MLKRKLTFYYSIMANKVNNPNWLEANHEELFNVVHVL